MQAFAEAARVLPELADLVEVLELFGDRAQVEVLATVAHEGVVFPIVALVVGARRPEAPTLGLIGGVHGLERIGTRVVLAALRTLAQFLTWDRVLSGALEEVRLIALPLLNPVGMWLHRRANGRHVDLMRNAPGHGLLATPLLGGHRLSPRLPWFAGDSTRDGLELEAEALCGFIRRWAFPASPAIVLDVHSGFGMVDRLWFPYAYTRRPFPGLAEAYALGRLLDETLPNHVYVLEPVSRNYIIQGDLWDYLYDEQRAGPGGGPFMPLTLELGSWLWIKKNPRQLFDLLGGFNPIRPHRLRRTLRRHLPLIEFLLRAVAGAEAWSQFEPHERLRLESEGFRRWFAR